MSIHNPAVIRYLLFLVVLLCFQPLYAEQAADKLTDSNNTYLQVARTQLILAVENYNNGNVDEAKHNLSTAKNWLDKAVSHTQLESVKQEAEKLSNDIQRFRLTMKNPDDKNDIVRFWRQSASLIKREADQLMHGYTELTNENRLLRLLLDAKMHFYIAEHDLFVSHHTHDAVDELKSSLSYLSQAKPLARQELQTDILHLTDSVNDILSRSLSSHFTSQQDVLISSLDNVMENLNRAEAVAPPGTRSRLEDIEQSVSELKNDTQSTNLKEQYDRTMEEFGRAIKHI